MSVNCSLDDRLKNFTTGAVAEVQKIPGLENIEVIVKPAVHTDGKTIKYEAEFNFKKLQASTNEIRNLGQKSQSVIKEYINGFLALKTDKDPLAEFRPVGSDIFIESDFFRFSLTDGKLSFTVPPKFVDLLTIVEGFETPTVGGSYNAIVQEVQESEARYLGANKVGSTTSVGNSSNTTIDTDLLVQQYKALKKEATSHLNFLKSQAILNPKNTELKKEVARVNSYLRSLNTNFESFTKSVTKTSDIILFIYDTIEALEKLVEKETLKNTNIISQHIKLLKVLLGDNTGNIPLFKNKSYSEIQTDDSYKQIFTEFYGTNSVINRLANIETKHSENIDRLLHNIIAIQLERIKKEEGKEITDEKAFNDEVSEILKELKERHAQDISKFEAFINEFSENHQDLKNLTKEQDGLTLFSLVARLYAFNESKAKQQSMRQKIVNIKPKLLAVLKANQESIQSVFYDKESEMARLVSVFKDDIYHIRNKAENLGSLAISNFLNAKDTKQIKKANGNVSAGYKMFKEGYNYVPLFLIPEIRAEYGIKDSETFSQAEKFKKHYIEEYGEVEYNLFLDSVYANIGNWQSFIEELYDSFLLTAVKPKSTSKYHSIEEYFNSGNNVRPEDAKRMEYIQKLIDRTSPFKISEKFLPRYNRVKKSKKDSKKLLEAQGKDTSKVGKTDYNEILDGLTDANHTNIMPLFITGVPKQDFLSQQYQDKILSNDVYREAYKLFQEVLLYINSQNYQTQNLEPFNIPYVLDITKQAQEDGLLKNLGKKTLEFLQKNFVEYGVANFTEVVPQDLRKGIRTVKAISSNMAYKAYIYILDSAQIGAITDKNGNNIFTVTVENGVQTVDYVTYNNLVDFIETGFLERNFGLTSEMLEKALETYKIRLIQKIEERYKGDNKRIEQEKIAVLANLDLKEFLKLAFENKLNETNQTDLFEIIEHVLPIAEKIEAKLTSIEELEFLRNRVEMMSRSALNNNEQELRMHKDLFESYLLRKIYGINRKSFVGERLKAIPMPKNNSLSKAMEEGVKEIKITFEEELELLREAKKNLDPDDTEQIDAYQEAIEAYEALLEEISKYEGSNYGQISPHKTLNFFLVKLQYYSAFCLNFKAAWNNFMYGTLNALEDDGISWNEGNYIKAREKYSLLKRSSRKIYGQIKGGEQNEGDQYLVAKLFFNRLGVFQNARNTVYKIDRGLQFDAAKRTFSSLRGLAGINSEAEILIQSPQILAILGSVDENKKPLFPITNKNGTKTVPVVNLEDGDLFPAFMWKDGELALKPEYDTADNRETWIDNKSDYWHVLASDFGPIGRKLSRINGNYADSHLYQYSNTVAGSLVFMFKRFAFNHYLKRLRVYNTAFKGNLGGEAALTEGMSNYLMFLNKAGVIGSLFGQLGPAMIIGSAAAIAFNTYNIKKNMQGMTSKDWLKLPIQLAKAVPRTAAFGTLKAIQMLTNAVGATTKTVGLHKKSPYIISNSQINSLMKMENNDATKALHFLATGFAYRMLLTVLRMALLAILKPDDDEDKAFKDDDELLFLQRVLKHPKVSTYHILDNMTVALIEDVNATSTLGATEKLLEPASSSMWRNTKDIFLHTDKKFEKGYKRGRNKSLFYATKYLGMPNSIQGKGENSIFGTMIPYDLNLGFGSYLETDYDTNSFIKQMFYTKKEEDKRLKETLNKEMNNLLKETNDFLQEGDIKMTENALEKYRKNRKINYSFSEKAGQETFNAQGEYNRVEDEVNFRKHTQKMQEEISMLKKMNKKERYEHIQKVMKTPIKTGKKESKISSTEFGKSALQRSEFGESVLKRPEF